jgi:RNA polymerase sigma-70 factor (ECF subfamily)
MTTLYLLFSEGYYSESQDTMLREDLCLEAMQLTHLLVAYEPTNLPPVNALLSLMCFHASRFEARRDRHGKPVLYDEQDETQWNQDLIVQGAYYLHRATTGDRLSKYHLEATIAYWNTQKADTPEKWEAILQLYNQLLAIAYSPVAALNRTYALSKVRGKAVAIPEAEQLKLDGNPFFFTLLGELYTDVDNSRALKHFEQALLVTRTAGDQQTIRRKIARLRGA